MTYLRWFRNVLMILGLTCLSARAGQVGLTAPGTNVYPNEEFRRVAGLSFRAGDDETTGVDSYLSMIGDAANGYVYVTANTTPAKIDKIKMGFGTAAPTRVGILTLQPSESHNGAAFIDPVGGFGYFAVGSPSKIIKVALGAGDMPPTRVAELTLNAGEVAQTVVVDPINGYAYLGTNQSPASIVKINLRAADFSTARIGALTLLDDAVDNSNDENSASAACIDLPAKQAYFATSTLPSIIVKIALGDDNTLPTRLGATKLNVNEDRVSSLAIDQAKGYIYAGSSVTTGFNLGYGAFVKLSITSDAAPAVRKAAISRPCERIVLDTEAGYAYASNRILFSSNNLSKIRLEAGDSTPTDVAQLNLDGHNHFMGNIDSTSGFAYLFNQGPPAGPRGEVVKIALGTGASAPTSVIRVGFNTGGQNAPLGLTIDPVTNTLFCATNARPFSALKLNAGIGNLAPEVVASVSGGGNPPGTAVVDVSDGYMYVPLITNSVQKYRLNPFSLVSTGSSGVTADFPRASAIDTLNKYAYFASGNSSRRFGKMKLNSGSDAVPSAISDVQLPMDAFAIILDEVNGFAYVPQTTTPASIIKIAVGTLDAAPTIVGTLTLMAGETNISCGVVDSVNKFAYFATSTSPSKIIKVNLDVAAGAVPTRVGAIDLVEGGVLCATYDARNAAAYFGTNDGKVIKVSTPATAALPVRLRGVALDVSDVALTHATFDTVRGYAYFSSYTSPGRVAKLATTPTGRMKATRVVLPNAASLTEMHFYAHGTPLGYAGSNKLRFAIYNNASPRELVWQSGEVINSASNAEITPVQIASGTPSIVTLQPGTYWLAWQSEAAVNVPSHSPGEFGDGFYIDQSFGPASSTLSGEVLSNERWTQYVTFVNSPASHAQFALTGNTSLVAGTPGTITITAQDIYGTTIPTYVGNKTITFSGPGASASPVTQPQIAGGNVNTARTVNFVNGVATVPMTLFKAESIGITAISGAISQIAPLNVMVAPSTDSKLAISGGSTQVAGSAQTVVLQTQDAYGNVPASFNGSLNVDFSGPGASPSGATPTAQGVTFANVPVSFTNGLASIALMLVKAESAQLIATGSGNFTPSLPFSIVVTPSAAATLQLANGGNVFQKMPTNITLTAKDAFGNAASTYTGTVSYISSDPLAVLPANQTLTAGQGATGLTRPVTLKTTGSQLVTVTDTSNGALSQTIALNVQLGITANDLNLSVFAGNPVAATLQAVDVSGGALNYAVISPPQNGTLTGTAPNLTYTPTNGYTGPDSFTFRANDGLLNSNVANVSITVAPLPSNKIPTISNLNQTSGSLNQAVFDLVVTGTNFSTGAVVNWNGLALATTFNSATQLTAQVTAVELASAGQIAVTVSNAAPEFATSNALSYFLYSGTVGTWVVTNTNDAGQGSLRLALASARNGDTVIFDPTVFDLVNSDAETLINVLSELPPLDDGSITIDASNRRVSVNGSAAGSARGLIVNSDGNIIQGLTLLGFARSGISLLPGSANNLLGGARSVGGGPNGQGLRISRNGTYGIEILGVGTTSNSVKGSWIGLDASGTSAQSNLAGIILGDGASSNIIGSTVADEENIISGNSLEGITIAGVGTDDNIIIGNTIGASAAIITSRDVGSREDGFQTRSSAGNGSAGLFLSKGTNGTKNGGTNSGEGNNVGFNGGNGIEVRSPNARRNSARSNRVTANSRGGIALFDGSNDNIKSPTVVSFLKVASTSGALSRGKISARIQGSTSGSGQVELFNDAGEQGAVLVGRTTSTNGTFESDIEVDDLLNLTATFTDENGNTSPFGFFGRATGNAGSPDDADGDGFSDTVETLAGTDPQSAAQAPISAGVLAVDAAKIGLNFASSNKDALAATVRIVLPEGVTLPQSTVGLQFSNVTKSFILDDKLKSPKAVSTLKASTSKTSSGVLLKFALKSEDLKAGLSGSGFTNTTTAKTGENKTVTLVLTLKSSTGTAYAYAGNVTLLYKATQGKTGKAAK